MKKGDKVTYSNNNKLEHGIIKNLTNDSCAFVVYHCASDWQNYEKYTAAKTAIEYLVEGWL